MTAAGTENIVTPASPDVVLGAVRKVLEAKRYTLVDEATGQGQVAFITRKTMLNWELDGLATVAPGAGGTQLSVTLQSRGDRPQALLDGKKNAKAAKKLAQEIAAALSG